MSGTRHDLRSWLTGVQTHQSDWLYSQPLVSNPSSSSSDAFSLSYFGKQNKSWKSPTQFTQSISRLMFVVKTNYGIIANLAETTVSQRVQGPRICQAWITWDFGRENVPEQSALETSAPFEGLWWDGVLAANREGKSKENGHGDRSVRFGGCDGFNIRSVFESSILCNFPKLSEHWFLIL